MVLCCTVTTTFSLCLPSLELVWVGLPPSPEGNRWDNWNRFCKCQMPVLSNQQCRSMDRKSRGMALVRENRLSIWSHHALNLVYQLTSERRHHALCAGCPRLLSALTTHHNHFTALFRDHPGEPVPEENFWTLWCKGRLTEADTDQPAGRHSIRTNQCPPPPSPIFYRPDALPAAHPTVSKHWRTVCTE